MIARGSVDDVVDRPDLAAVPVELHEIEGLLGKVLIEQLRGADVVVVGHRGPAAQRRGARVGRAAVRAARAVPAPG